MQPGQVDAFQPGQSRPARRQFVPVGVQKPDAQGGGHPRAAVVGGAAAQADDEAGKAPFQRLPQQFAGAVGGGGQRVAAALGDEGQPGGTGHFDNRRFAVAHHAPAGFQGLAQWPGHLAGEHLPAGAFHQGVQRAVAPVGHRRQHYCGLGQSGGHPPGDGLRRLQPGYSGLESLRRNHDFHTGDYTRRRPACSRP